MTFKKCLDCKIFNAAGHIQVAIILSSYICYWSSHWLERVFCRRRISSFVLVLTSCSNAVEGWVGRTLQIWVGFKKGAPPARAVGRPTWTTAGKLTTAWTAAAPAGQSYSLAGASQPSQTLPGRTWLCHVQAGGEGPWGPVTKKMYLCTKDKCIHVPKTSVFMW